MRVLIFIILNLFMYIYGMSNKKKSSGINYLNKIENVSVAFFNYVVVTESYEAAELYDVVFQGLSVDDQGMFIAPYKSRSKERLRKSLKELIQYDTVTKNSEVLSIFRENNFKMINIPYSGLLLPILLAVKFPRVMSLLTVCLTLASSWYTYTKPS